MFPPIGNQPPMQQQPCPGGETTPARQPRASASELTKSQLIGNQQQLTANLAAFYASFPNPLPQRVDPQQVVEALIGIFEAKERAERGLRQSYFFACSHCYANKDKDKDKDKGEWMKKLVKKNITNCMASIPQTTPSPNQNYLKMLLANMNPLKAINRHQYASLLAFSEGFGLYMPGQNQNPSAYDGPIHGPGCGENSMIDFFELGKAGGCSQRQLQELSVLLCQQRALTCQDSSLAIAVKGNYGDEDDNKQIPTRGLVPGLIAAGLTGGEQGATAYLLAVAWKHGWNPTQTCALAKLASSTPMTSQELMVCYKELPGCMEGVKAKIMAKIKADQQAGIMAELGFVPPLSTGEPGLVFV